MKVLIVYEEVPENTKFYTVEVTPEDWEWMRLTHDQFVNGATDDVAENACNRLSVWLEKQQPIVLKSPLMIRGENYDYVLHTGFLL